MKDPFDRFLFPFQSLFQVRYTHVFFAFANGGPAAPIPLIYSCRIPPMSLKMNPDVEVKTCGKGRNDASDGTGLDTAARDCC